MEYTLSQLAEQVGGTIVGNGDCVISCVAPVEDAGAGAISFVSSPKFVKYLADTRAEAVIVKEAQAVDLPVPALVVTNPRATYGRIASLLYPSFRPAAGVHATAVIENQAKIDPSAYIGANAVIESGAVIGANTYIGAGCVIGRNARIGTNTYIHANVTVYFDCHVGNDCIIHSGAVIGADGFGFEHDEGGWVKIPQIGIVRIGNQVEIGACSTVDRGAVSDTVVEDGVKLDNHIQIGHGAKIGEHSIMSNGVGVAGSTTVGKNVIVGGMAGIRDNIEIADNVMITAMSLVSKSLDKPGSYSSGTPIDDTRNWRKNTVRFRQLDELAKRVQQLEKLVNK